MPRKLKPTKIDPPVKDEFLGIEVEIFFDREGEFFFATVEQERFQDDAVAPLRRAVADRLATMRNLTWIPVIELEMAEWFARSDENLIGFDMDRIWIARKGTGRWIYARWDCETDGRRVQDASSLWTGRGEWDGSFPLRVESHRGGKYLVAYTEEVWNGLERIQEGIRAAKAKLETLLSTPEGIARIASAGLPLGLPAAPVPPIQPDPPPAKTLRRTDDPSVWEVHSSAVAGDSALDDAILEVLARHPDDWATIRAVWLVFVEEEAREKDFPELTPKKIGTALKRMAEADKLEMEGTVLLRFRLSRVLARRMREYGTLDASLEAPAKPAPAARLELDAQLYDALKWIADHKDTIGQDNNVLAALMDRGLIVPAYGDHPWAVTDQGRKALELYSAPAPQDGVSLDDAQDRAAFMLKVAPGLGVQIGDTSDEDDPDGEFTENRDRMERADSLPEED